MMKKSMLFYMLLLICGANASFAQSQTWLDSILNRVVTIQEETVVSCRNLTVVLTYPTPNDFYRYYWFAEDAASDSNYISTGNSCQLNIQSDTTIYCIGFPVGSGTIYRATRYNIHVPSNDTIRDTVKTCNSYTWHGRSYDTTGIFYDTVERDCDTTFYILNLTIVKGITYRLTRCVPFHLNWNGHDDVISDSDTHSYQRVVTDAGLTFGQCVVTDKVILNPSGRHDTLPDLDTSACDSLSYGSITYYVSQITEPEQVGVNNTTNQCYIYQRLNLTINHSTTGTETVSACNNYQWHGHNYFFSTNSPTYTDTTSFGCDSVVTLHLTIRYSSPSATETVTVCDEYTWHGTTYTASTNSPTYTEKNAAGCDSVVMLNLTVNYSNTGIDQQSVCDSLNWHGITYTTSTNTPTYTNTNTDGCDSVVTLNLTVNHSVDSTIFATACGYYQNNWLNIFYENPTSQPLTKDTTIKHSQTAFGCDSNYTLHLILNPITKSDIYDTACDNYTWYGQSYNSTGIDSVTVRNQYGCDSIITLHLLIIPSYSTDTSVRACDKYTWNDSTYYTTGTYCFNNNATPCPGTDTLHLTIIHHEGKRTEKIVCDTFSFGGVVYRESATIHQITPIDNCNRVDTIHLNVLGIKIPPEQELVRKEHPQMLIYPIPYSDTNEDYHFQWFRGKDTIENATRNYYKLTDEDKMKLVYDSIYTVKIWNKLEMCSSESSDTISIIPSQDNPQIETLPNPNTGRFTATLLADDEEAAEAILFNSYGSKIATLPLDGNTATSVGSLTTGVYLLNIITRSGKLFTDKIIVK